MIKFLFHNFILKCFLDKLTISSQNAIIILRIRIVGERNEEREV
jgi:hypothetical protein